MVLLPSYVSDKHTNTYYMYMYIVQLHPLSLSLFSLDYCVENKSQCVELITGVGGDDVVMM